MDKVRVIERSMRCYSFGWLSFIPFLGIAAAVLAIWLHFTVQRDVAEQWNPAGAYLRWGWYLALLGVCGWVAWTAFLIVAVMQGKL